MKNWPGENRIAGFSLNNLISVDPGIATSGKKAMTMTEDSLGTTVFTRYARSFSKLNLVDCFCLETQIQMQESVPATKAATALGMLCPVTGTSAPPIVAAA